MIVRGSIPVKESTMALSLFDDKTKTPQDGTLADALGRAWSRWNELKSALSAQHGPLAEEWVFGGKNWGWSLRLKHKKRAIVYLTPCRRHFLAGLALGEKAVKAARQSDLSATVLQLIDDATKYAEGRAVRIEVRHKRDVDIVVKLAAAKMAN